MPIARRELGSPHPDAVGQAQASGERDYWHMERLLAALRPRVVGVGHLGPMTGPGVVAELEAAAR